MIPTPELIERVAKAIWDAKPPEDFADEQQPKWDELDESKGDGAVKDEMRCMARAAIEVL